jgi:galactokinase
MSTASAREKGKLLVRCDAELDAAGASAKRWSIWVPGRIEVLGKHTDYAGGRSLLCAVERGFCLRAAPRDDATVRVNDVVRGGTVEVTLGEPAAAAPEGDWSRYVAAVARRLPRDFPVVTRGVEIALGGDLPVAAGMSGSSALVVAVVMALGKANALGSTPEFRDVLSSREELATYLGCVESGAPFRGRPGDEGVGTLGGCQDHTAIVCAEAGRLVGYRWSPVRRETAVGMPDGHVFVIASSGVEAAKTAGARVAYNRVSRLARELLRLWNGMTYRNDATLADALASAPDAADRLRGYARSQPVQDFQPDELAARLEQFVVETEVIVPAAARALSDGSLGGFGAYVDWSQWAAERFLGNQVPETSALARAARALGAAAASAFGAGFGGSVWALVPERKAARFLEQWQSGYRRSHPSLAARAEFFITHAGPAAYQW